MPVPLQTPPKGILAKYAGAGPTIYKGACLEEGAKQNFAVCLNIALAKTALSILTKLNTTEV